MQFGTRCTFFLRYFYKPTFWWAIQPSCCVTIRQFDFAVFKLNTKNAGQHIVLSLSRKNGVFMCYTILMLWVQMRVRSRSTRNDTRQNNLTIHKDFQTWFLHTYFNSEIFCLDFTQVRRVEALDWETRASLLGENSARQKSSKTSCFPTRQYSWYTRS